MKILTTKLLLAKTQLSFLPSGYHIDPPPSFNSTSVQHLALGRSLTSIIYNIETSKHEWKLSKYKIFLTILTWNAKKITCIENHIQRLKNMLGPLFSFIVYVPVFNLSDGSETHPETEHYTNSQCKWIMSKTICINNFYALWKLKYSFLENTAE